MIEDTLLPFDLPSVARKKVSVAFDGGMLSSNGGVLLLRGVERRLGLAARLAGCIRDRRNPESILHTVEEMLRLRMFAIAAGYADGNDCDALRHDPAFKMAVGACPRAVSLCARSRPCRGWRMPGEIALKRMMAAMVELFCDSYRRAPPRSCSTSTTPRRGSRPAAAVAVQRPLRQPLLPADPHLRGDQRQAGGDHPAPRQDAGRRGGARGPAHVVGHIRGRWPAVDILVRGDSHYGRPEAMAWCEEPQGSATSSASPATRCCRPDAARSPSDARGRAPAERRQSAATAIRYAAKSWNKRAPRHRPRRGHPAGSDSRFIVTSLAGRPKASTRRLCARGAGENSSRRTSSTSPPTAPRAARPRPTSSA